MEVAGISAGPERLIISEYPTVRAPGRPLFSGQAATSGLYDAPGIAPTGRVDAQDVRSLAFFFRRGYRWQNVNRGISNDTKGGTPMLGEVTKEDLEAVTKHCNKLIAEVGKEVTKVKTKVSEIERDLAEFYLEFKDVVNSLRKDIAKSQKK
jgi:hypothetical protein